MGPGTKGQSASRTSSELAVATPIVCRTLTHFPQRSRADPDRSNIAEPCVVRKAKTTVRPTMPCTGLQQSIRDHREGPPLFTFAAGPADLNVQSGVRFLYSVVKDHGGQKASA
jgi:hypothetical protein